MAAQTLLDDQTADIDGDGVSVTDACMVVVRGVFAGAAVVLQVSEEDVEASYVDADTSLGQKATFRGPGTCIIDGKGTYFVRARQKGSTATTSITAKTNQ